MSARRPRRRGMEEEAPENHERWLVSYADMVTVIMALFIVLYAISQVDQDKYESLRSSLADGFGVAQASILPDGGGPMTDVGSAVRFPTIDSVVPNLTDGLVPENASGDLSPLLLQEQTEEYEAMLESALGAASEVDMQAAVEEYDHLAGIRSEINSALASKDLDGSVDFRVTQEGLMIGMVTNDMFFATASNDLTALSRAVIDTITPRLTKLPNQITVEGHADVIPNGSMYKTNWELSSARATTVLRRMVEDGDLQPARVAAVGFGDARPLVEGKSKKALAANRRVDLVVLSGQPERVRALLPIVEESRK